MTTNKTSKAQEKRNTFSSFVAALTDQYQSDSNSFKAKKEQLDSVKNADQFKEEEKAERKYNTKSKYVNLINSKMSDKAFNKMLQCKVTEEQIQEISKASYSIKKLLGLFEMIVSNKSVSVEKHTVDFFAYCAKQDFTDIDREKAFRELGHKGDTQLNYYIRFLRRLDLATKETKHNRVVFSFNKKHPIYKELTKLFIDC